MKKPRRKPRTLQAWWGRIENGTPLDLCADWGEGLHKSDANYLLNHLGPILDKLVKRGFDQNTLRFSIELKPAPPSQP